ncbi:hypothetical protein BLNAU_15425 [Blattamonas nauphoetae]|uniref:Cleavage/polyadenylation specificity factor A subunit C-terminal domain-containing protein n=1 Tax=Blattamonas nauphoetae TaxID=2049346 RepID=A0ABQ9XFP0_9EUKA|nr:hypothetical protein BLNAU_15425 [Blattamonas nauphoetae]
MNVVDSQNQQVVFDSYSTYNNCEETPVTGIISGYFHSRTELSLITTKHFQTFRAIHSIFTIPQVDTLDCVLIISVDGEWMLLQWDQEEFFPLATGSINNALSVLSHNTAKRRFRLNPSFVWHGEVVPVSRDDSPYLSHPKSSAPPEMVERFPRVSMKYILIVDDCVPVSLSYEGPDAPTMRLIKEQKDNILKRILANPYKFTSTDPQSSHLLQLIPDLKNGLEREWGFPSAKSVLADEKKTIQSQINDGDSHDPLHLKRPVSPRLVRHTRPTIKRIVPIAVAETFVFLETYSSVESSQIKINNKATQPILKDLMKQHLSLIQILTRIRHMMPLCTLQPVSFPLFPLGSSTTVPSSKSDSETKDDDSEDPNPTTQLLEELHSTKLSLLSSSASKNTISYTLLCDLALGVSLIYLTFDFTTMTFCWYPAIITNMPQTSHRLYRLSDQQAFSPFSLSLFLATLPDSSPFSISDVFVPSFEHFRRIVADRMERPREKSPRSSSTSPINESTKQTHTILPPHHKHRRLHSESISELFSLSEDYESINTHISVLKKNIFENSSISLPFRCTLVDQQYPSIPFAVIGSDHIIVSSNSSVQHVSFAPHLFSAIPLAVYAFPHSLMSSQQSLVGTQEIKHRPATRKLEVHSRLASGAIPPPHPIVPQSTRTFLNKASLTLFIVSYHRMFIIDEGKMQTVLFSSSAVRNSHFFPPQNLVHSTKRNSPLHVRTSNPLIFLPAIHGQSSVFSVPTRSFIQRQRFSSFLPDSFIAKSVQAVDRETFHQGLSPRDEHIFIGGFNDLTTIRISKQASSLRPILRTSYFNILPTLFSSTLGVGHKSHTLLLINSTMSSPETNKTQSTSLLYRFISSKCHAINAEEHGVKSHGLTLCFGPVEHGVVQILGTEVRVLPTRKLKGDPTEKETEQTRPQPFSASRFTSMSPPAEFETVLPSQDRIQKWEPPPSSELIPYGHIQKYKEGQIIIEHGSFTHNYIAVSFHCHVILLKWTAPSTICPNGLLVHTQTLSLDSAVNSLDLFTFSGKTLLVVGYGTPSSLRIFGIYPRELGIATARYCHEFHQQHHIARLKTIHSIHPLDPLHFADNHFDDIVNRGVSKHKILGLNLDESMTCTVSQTGEDECVLLCGSDFALPIYKTHLTNFNGKTDNDGDLVLFVWFETGSIEWTVLDKTLIVPIIGRTQPLRDVSRFITEDALKWTGQIVEVQNSVVFRGNTLLQAAYDTARKEVVCIPINVKDRVTSFQPLTIKSDPRWVSSHFSAVWIQDLDKRLTFGTLTNPARTISAHADKTTKPVALCAIPLLDVVCVIEKFNPSMKGSDGQPDGMIFDPDVRILTQQNRTDEKNGTYTQSTTVKVKQDEEDWAAEQLNDPSWQNPATNFDSNETHLKPNLPPTDTSDPSTQSSSPYFTTDTVASPFSRFDAQSTRNGMKMFRESVIMHMFGTDIINTSAATRLWPVYNTPNMPSHSKRGTEWPYRDLFVSEFHHATPTFDANGIPYSDLVADHFIGRYGDIQSESDIIPTLPDICPPPPLCYTQGTSFSDDVPPTEMFKQINQRRKQNRMGEDSSSQATIKPRAGYAMVLYNSENFSLGMTMTYLSTIPREIAGTEYDKTERPFLYHTFSQITALNLPTEESTVITQRVNEVHYLDQLGADDSVLMSKSTEITDFSTESYTKEQSHALVAVCGKESLESLQNRQANEYTRSRLIHSDILIFRISRIFSSTQDHHQFSGFDPSTVDIDNPNHLISLNKDHPLFIPTTFPSFHGPDTGVMETLSIQFVRRIRILGPVHSILAVPSLLFVLNGKFLLGFSITNSSSEADPTSFIPSHPPTKTCSCTSALFDSDGLQTTTYPAHIEFIKPSPNPDRFKLLQYSPKSEISIDIVMHIKSQGTLTGMNVTGISDDPTLYQALIRSLMFPSKVSELVSHFKQEDEDMKLLRENHLQAINQATRVERAYRIIFVTAPNLVSIVDMYLPPGFPLQMQHTPLVSGLCAFHKHLSPAAEALLSLARSEQNKPLMIQVDNQTDSPGLLTPLSPNIMSPPTHIQPTSLGALTQRLETSRLAPLAPHIHYSKAFFTPMVQTMTGMTPILEVDSVPPPPIAYDLSSDIFTSSCAVGFVVSEIVTFAAPSIVTNVLMHDNIHFTVISDHDVLTYIIAANPLLHTKDHQTLVCSECGENFEKECLFGRGMVWLMQRYQSNEQVLSLLHSDALNKNEQNRTRTQLLTFYDQIKQELDVDWKKMLEDPTFKSDLISPNVYEAAKIAPLELLFSYSKSRSSLVPLHHYTISHPFLFSSLPSLPPMQIFTTTMAFSFTPFPVTGYHNGTLLCLLQVPFFEQTFGTAWRHPTSECVLQNWQMEETVYEHYLESEIMNEFEETSAISTDLYPCAYVAFPLIVNTNRMTVLNFEMENFLPSHPNFKREKATKAVRDAYDRFAQKMLTRFNFRYKLRSKISAFIEQYSATTGHPPTSETLQTLIRTTRTTKPFDNPNITRVFNPKAMSSSSNALQPLRVQFGETHPQLPLQFRSLDESEGDTSGSMFEALEDRDWADSHHENEQDQFVFPQT